MCFISMISYGQRKDYYSVRTTIGNTINEASQAINENVYISINEGLSSINLNFIGQDIIMTLYFASVRMIDGYKFYYVNKNLWNIHAVAFKENGDNSSLTFLYVSPNTTVWVFSPLKKM